MAPVVEVPSIPTALDEKAFSVIKYRNTIEEMYFLDDPPYARQLEFFKYATGIHDPAKLKKHILAISAYAFEIFPYPCIRVGTDLRQIVHEGYSKENVLGIDVKDAWLEISRQLFKDSGFPFLNGNIMEDKFFNLEGAPEAISAPDATSSPATDLASVKTLTELKSRVRFITSNMFFHLFDETGQLELARRFSVLLDNRKGSAIFGCQCGLFNPKLIHDIGGRGEFLHSPESWRNMWLKIYLPEKVKIEAELRSFGVERLDQIPGMENVKLLWWSVTIL